jgi:hypothetical protein
MMNFIKIWRTVYDIWWLFKWNLSAVLLANTPGCNAHMAICRVNWQLIMYCATGMLEQTKTVWTVKCGIPGAKSLHTGPVANNQKPGITTNSQWYCGTLWDYHTPPRDSIPKCSQGVSSCCMTTSAPCGTPCTGRWWAVPHTAWIHHCVASMCSAPTKGCGWRREANSVQWLQQ